jgi:FkbM family methyltransferase
MRSPMWIKLHRLFLVVVTTNNWLSSILVWSGFYKKKMILFRNGFQFELEKKNWITYLEHVYLFYYFPDAQIFNNSLKFKFKNKTLSFDFGCYGCGTILEIFAGEPYKEFFEKTDINKKTVLDIGAAFGDTAILFLLAGAEKVFAVEAFPEYWKLASKNIQANGFEARCEVLLSAVSGHSGVLKIDKNLEEMFGIGIRENEIGQEVPIITIEQIVKQNNIKDAILKLDVEGYEYEILFNTTSEILRSFTDMVIEYHYGHEKIVPYLEAAGFKVSHTGPFDVHMSHLHDESVKNMQVGNIYAKRLDF